MAETAAGPKVFRKDDMMKVPAFAKELGVSRRQAYNYIEWGPANGGVLSFRFGRKKALRIPREELHRMKQSRIVCEG